ncbi:MAG: tetratricopeptide repeat protein [Bacteriovorax sp.]|nr:tetratricopeptide repeat protein [Bacteriovorax sp.]
MRKPRLLLAAPLLLAISFNLNAQSISLTEFNQFFKSAQYTKALSILEKSDSKDFPNGQSFYFEGICHAKLQEYDKAIKSFEKAIKEKNTSLDLQYEYGQALYAANELKAARNAFKESIHNKFNVPASTYYVAHISQILEEYIEAKDGYTEIIKNKDSDVKLKQVARFQLAETLLLIMRDKIKGKEEQEKSVAKYIIPMMKEASNTDKGTQLSFEIDQRLNEIQKEFNLDPNLLINGRRISAKRYSGYLTQKIKFDDNISLTNEINNIQQSKQESFIYESEAYAKYDFLLKKKFIMSPEARVNFIKHSNQDSADVYQNDALSINLNLKNKYEHLINAKPASFLFDIELSNTKKDWNQKHQREAYANTTTFGVGEAFSYFNAGDTTFKFKYKDFAAKTETLSSHTLILSGDQTVSVGQSLIIALIEADFINNYNNTTNNTNTYLARVDYLIPDIFPKYTLGLAVSATITDTEAQMTTRGTEFTFNPSIDLSKALNDNMKITLNYDYSSNKSKLSSYDYNKHVITSEFRYSF